MNVVTMVIKSRHSVREFKPDSVDQTIIRDAIECARQAPTAMNLQPWLFGVLQDKGMLRKIADLTDHGKFITKAAVCFAVFGEKNVKYYLEDCCAATENLIIALQAYGISSCWVAGDKKPYAEDVRKLLNVPDTYTLVSLVPAGLPAEISVAKKKDLKLVHFKESFKKDAS
ncbi:MAG: nitroreductase family protein [Methanoregula sp.]|nr:MAG: nitroreductase family protein [Methanoregula sp.]